MMISKGNSGANKRFSAILFITSMVLSLAPSVVGPPERNFKKGQPELQQSMDNMVVREEFMKRSLQQPSSGDKDIPFLPLRETNQLLKEAERILPATKDKKQKEWMEDIIHKLKVLSSVTERNVANQSNNDSNNSITQDVAQSPSNSTVPVRNSLQQSPYDSLPRTVPKSTPQPQLSSQITSELSMTVPNVNQVNYSNQHQARLRENPVENDELVRELESLRKASPIDLVDQQDKAPETSSRNIDKGTHSLLSKEKGEEKLKIEKQKAMIKMELVEEVKKLKSLGETDKEILDALPIDGFKPVDSKKTQKETGNNEINKFEKTVKNSEEHVSVKRVLDAGNGKVSPDINKNYWNIPAHQAPEEPRQIYMNNTFLGMHINLPPMNPRVIRRQFYGMHRNSANRNSPFHRGGLKDTIQKLQAENHQNFLLRNHGLGVPNALQQERLMHYGPMNARPYGAPQSVNRYPPDNPAMYRYPNANIRPLYMPYPLNQNLDSKNEVLNKSKSEITYSTDPIQTELSEEMKRQLRDGKVILLSDSVVRSNFTADSEGVTEKPKN